MAHVPPANQEDERISRGWAVGAMLFVLVVASALGFVADRLLRLRAHRLRHAPSAAEVERPEPSVSAIQQQTFRQRASGQDLKAAQRQALREFGWVDRARGIVQIPIDDAIDLELAEHRP